MSSLSIDQTDVFLVNGFVFIACAKLLAEVGRWFEGKVLSGRPAEEPQSPTKGCTGPQTLETVV